MLDACLVLMALFVLPAVASEPAGPTDEGQERVKRGRFEFKGRLGALTNDPLVRQVLGGVALSFHPTDTVAFAGSFTGSPDLGDSNYSALTTQLVNENQVTTDISMMRWSSDLSLEVSPIHGEFLVGHGVWRLDLVGVLGGALVRTRDDLESMQNTSEVALATERQVHPALLLGGGVRLMPTRAIALSVEARRLAYVEVLETAVREPQRPISVLVGFSVFSQE